MVDLSIITTESINGTPADTNVQTGGVANANDNIKFLTNIDLILKANNLTHEQWLAMSAEEQQVYIDNAGDIKSIGISLESNPDNPVVKKITEAELQEMSPEQRLDYFKEAFMNAHLQGVSEEDYKKIINELLDSRLRQEYKNYDKKLFWGGEKRRERLRQELLSDIILKVKNNFTDEEYNSLSYTEKLELKLKNNEEVIFKLQEKIESGQATEKEIAQIKELDKHKTDYEKALAISDRASNLSEEEINNSAITSFVAKYGEFSVDNKDKYLKFLTERYANLSDEEKYEAKLTDTLALLNYAQKNNDEQLQKMVLEVMKHEHGFYSKENCEYVRTNKIPNPDRLEQVNDEFTGLADLYNDKEALEIAADMQATITDKTGRPVTERYQEIALKLKNTVLMQKSFQNACPGSKNIMNESNRLTTLADSSCQIELTQMNMDYTETFDNDQDKIEAQKSIGDTVHLLEKENQSEAYKIVMSSEFEEVQEYAASNIYKLDESVRDWAVDYTNQNCSENVRNAIQIKPPVNESGSNQNSSTNASQPTQNKTYIPNTALNQTPTKVADNKPQQQEKYTISQALRYVDTDTRAQSELIQLSKTTDFTTFLTTLSNNDRKLVIEKLCKYGSTNDIYDLLCNNLNYCDSILRIAGNKLSGKMEQIIMMLLNKHDNPSIAQAKNLAKQEPKYMPLIAIKTNDAELIKEIVKNPLSYRIQPGSDTHRELLRKSNSIRSGLSSDNNGLNIKKA